MGIFDKAKQLAEDNADKLDDAIDKVADVADDRTGGKFSDQIDKGADAAKGLADKVGGEDEQEPPSRISP
jgi:ABC-type transporter Mla subunit MlaD